MTSARPHGLAAVASLGGECVDGTGAAVKAARPHGPATVAGDGTTLRVHSSVTKVDSSGSAVTGARPHGPAIVAGEGWMTSDGARAAVKEARPHGPATVAGDGTIAGVSVNPSGSAVTEARPHGPANVAGDGRSTNDRTGAAVTGARPHGPANVPGDGKSIPARVRAPLPQSTTCKRVLPSVNLYSLTPLHDLQSTFEPSSSTEPPRKLVVASGRGKVWLVCCCRKRQGVSLRKPIYGGGVCVRQF